jgi:3-isopropylmalate/(R)-2-methylmalate dehydratase small subunit
MEPYRTFTGVVAPLYRADVDTDQILPKQFLKLIDRTGFGKHLFADWRYTTSGEEKPDFVLNRERYRSASILLAGRNFGCGSSREHAPWALVDAGFRAIVAPSYADIFYNNCFKNGLLPIAFDASIIEALLAECEAIRGWRLTIDLEPQAITTPSGVTHRFEIDPFRKRCLLLGLDDIAMTLEHEEQIASYEAARAKESR